MGVTDSHTHTHAELEVVAARWAQRKLLRVAGGIAHERRVLEIAVKLLDLTRPLLHLTSHHTRLLRLACLLHDVGRCISERHHPADGAGLIASAAALPLTPADRRALCFLTRYHRGAVPPAGRDDILTAADDRMTLDRILALLRTADGLDNRQLPPLELTFRLDDNRLRIEACASGDVRRARQVFTRRKKFRMLEQCLGQDIEVDVRRMPASALA